ncbi:MAG: hypothetical protein HY695_21950, partial [Deltaproteobacteria bacterium]|nr:hypothetical protein [Deltaproteobacteria bacterium]
LGVQAKPLAYKEFDFKKNDVLYMRMASGGGYGDPLERDPQLVLDDINDGIISVQVAHKIYGVVLDENGLTIDWAGTEKHRAALQTERLLGIDESSSIR